MRNITPGHIRQKKHFFSCTYYAGQQLEKQPDFFIKYKVTLPGMFIAKKHPAAGRIGGQ
jgi:hypothetical protein